MHLYSFEPTFPKQHFKQILVRRGAAEERGLPDGLFSKPKMLIWVNFGMP
jgi:hypothetical protein